MGTSACSIGTGAAAGLDRSTGVYGGAAHRGIAGNGERGRRPIRSRAQPSGAEAEARACWLHSCDARTALKLMPRGKALEREVKELRQANEILRKASAYFAQAELDRPLKR